MTEREFVSTFEKQKKLFIRQVMPGDNNRKALDLFEKWLKGRLLTGQNARKNRTDKKKELSVLLDKIISKASSLLENKGIRINCVSFIVPGAKTNSRCIRVDPYENIFYRICKTSPRKGKYSGKNLIAVELVMDGNKNNIFLPLLTEKEQIEKDLGMEIERERHAIEATGKYRFKILFNLDEYEEKEIIRQLGYTTANFILVTCGYLQKISNNNINESIHLSP